ncbi:glutathione S-transferase N-terminal domain-containing protein [uncultured Algimonas sp.]|uniref:glutathione S-transferase N-terminal domain-containing protein n=1 Tax=uncultured Algimonas sp. TaxID=1547920 RepID=UPI002623D28C|nr:glutathione S-transferase N-terminal domain-containing protein [uncultured Algimonas sp.]
MANGRDTGIERPNPMSLPILYSFRRCPFAMRARMALDASDTWVEHREVLLRDKPAAMLDASPKGTVPVLVTDDNGVLDESLDIMIWALRRHDPENWLADQACDQADAERFLDAFKDRLDRYKYASRYDPEQPRGAVDPDQRDAAMQVLTHFAATLNGTPFLRGAAPRLVDIATFPFVRQFAAVEPDWWAQAAPEGVQRWLAGHLASPRFKRIMRKWPLWDPEAARNG